MSDPKDLRIGSYQPFGTGYHLMTHNRGVILVDNWKELQEELAQIPAEFRETQTK